jgi:hypothetical protein
VRLQNFSTHSPLTVHQLCERIMRSGVFHITWQSIDARTRYSDVQISRPCVARLTLVRRTSSRNTFKPILVTEIIGTNDGCHVKICFGSLSLLPTGALLLGITYMSWQETDVRIWLIAGLALATVLNLVISAREISASRALIARMCGPYEK